MLSLPDRIDYAGYEICHKAGNHPHTVAVLTRFVGEVQADATKEERRAVVALLLSYAASADDSALALCAARIAAGQHRGGAR